MGTLAYCENPEEMQLIAAFHQRLYCLLRLKHPLGTKMHVHHNSEVSMGDPLRHKMDNPRPPDKSVYWKISFFISHPKHMLWVLKRTVSMKRLFKLNGKKIITILS